MVDRAYEIINSEFLGNQDAYGEIKNYETGKPIWSEDTELTKSS